MGDVSTRNPDLLRGTVELLILKALTHGRQHGFGIARCLEDVTVDVLRIEEGSLYPALHKLEEKGFIVAEWGISEHNRKAKFYRLTAAGKKQLAAANDYWARFAEAVFKVLKTSPA